MIFVHMLLQLALLGICLVPICCFVSLVLRPQVRTISVHSVKLLTLVIQFGFCPWVRPASQVFVSFHGLPPHSLIHAEQLQFPSFAVVSKSRLLKRSERDRQPMNRTWAHFHFLFGVMSLNGRSMASCSCPPRWLRGFLLQRSLLLSSMDYHLVCSVSLMLCPGCFSIFMYCCFKAHFPCWRVGPGQHLCRWLVSHCLHFLLLKSLLVQWNGTWAGGGVCQVLLGKFATQPLWHSIR